MAAPSKLRAGDGVGPYKLVREIGRGAMATVFEATRAEGKPLALKVLHPHVALHPELRERFEREGRILQALRHENVARVYDVGVLPDGTLYLGIELLTGSDLGSLLDNAGVLSIGAASKYVLEAAAGVAEAHAHGVVHHDLKPANIFLAKNRRGQEVVKVLDFGVAKVVGAVESEERAREVIGSPHFMAPEQLQGSGAVTPRTDVWALGVILYKALTETCPFEAASISELCRKIREDMPQPIRDVRPDCPVELQDVVLRCLAKNPAARFKDAGELADALAPFAAEEYDDVTRIQEESTRFMPIAREMQRQSAIASLTGLRAAPEAPPSMRPMGPASVSIVSAVSSFQSLSSGSISALASPALSAPVRGASKKQSLPWLFVGGAAIVGALLLTGAGYVALGRGRLAGAPSSVKVRVTSQPEGALFTLDYGTQMRAPGELTVRSDDRAHILTVWKDGFRPETRYVNTTADVDVQVKLLPVR